jgi:hypothetical protein
MLSHEQGRKGLAGLFLAMLAGALLLAGCSASPEAAALGAWSNNSGYKVEFFSDKTLIADFPAGFTMNNSNWSFPQRTYGTWSVLTDGRVKANFATSPYGAFCLIGFVDGNRFSYADSKGVLVVCTKDRAAGK